MRHYGLIGFPLGHSFSERYFNGKFNYEGIEGCEYRNFELDTVDLLPELLAANPLLKGLNVTIPYKEQVMPLLDVIDPVAREVGAVNCIAISNNSKLHGYNTDVYGFRKSLTAFIGGDRPRAIILGTGGVSKAVRYVLREMGIDFTVVSRYGSEDAISYDDIDRGTMQTHTLIINTTPLGTHPNIDTAPQLPYQHIDERHCFFDVVYNPPVSKFLRLGAEHGASICNGYEMLVGQAEKSWEIWEEYYQAEMAGK